MPLRGIAVAAMRCQTLIGSKCVGARGAVVYATIVEWYYIQYYGVAVPVDGGKAKRVYLDDICVRLELDDETETH